MRRIDVGQLRAIKLRPGKDIAVTGGTLVRSLMPDGLLDEPRLLVHPMVVDSRTFDSGVVCLTHRRSGD